MGVEKRAALPKPSLQPQELPASTEVTPLGVARRMRQELNPDSAIKRLLFVGSTARCKGWLKLLEEPTPSAKAHPPVVLPTKGPSMQAAGGCEVEGDGAGVEVLVAVAWPGVGEAEAGQVSLRTTCLASVTNTMPSGEAATLVGPCSVLCSAGAASNPSAGAPLPIKVEVRPVARL